jgi:hypothetical protein
VANSDHAKELLATATAREQQQKQGRHDPDDMEKLAETDEAAVTAQWDAKLSAVDAGTYTQMLGAFRHLDCAEYVHSALAVVDLPGKGRGLVVTKAVKAGQLLIAERADQVSYSVSVPQLQGWCFPVLYGYNIRVYR